MDSRNGVEGGRTVSLIGRYERTFVIHAAFRDDAFHSPLPPPPLGRLG